MAKRQVNANVKWHEFVPWVVTSAFGVLIIGLAVWASQSARMVDLSATALADLGLSVEARMHTVGKAWIGWMTTMYVLMGISSLTVAVWRRFLKVTSESRGRREHVTRRWLLCHSVTIGIWYFILLLLVLIIVGQALWLATAYAIDKAAMVGARTVERHLNASRAANISRSIFIDPPGTCNSTCVDLSEFEVVLGTGLNKTCVCNLDGIRRADTMVSGALAAVGGSTVGAVFMFVAATCFLMAAAGDQSATRRELAIMKEFEAQEAAGGDGLLSRSRTMFWKKGAKRKKGPGEGGDDAAPGQELATIHDEEHGGGPEQQQQQQQHAAGGPDKSVGKSKPKGKTKAAGSRNNSDTDDSASLLSGRPSSHEAPKRSGSSIFDMSKNIGRGMNDAVSKGFSGAMSGAKKGSSKLFGAALRGAMGLS